jgi:hypothetical protein
MSMLAQALQLAPYVAIASGILLGTTIGIICYRQCNRDAGSGDAARVDFVDFPEVAATSARQIAARRRHS